MENIDKLALIISIICLIGLAFCIRYMKKKGLWMEMKSAFIVSIEETLPIWIGISAGIATHILLNI